MNGYVLAGYAVTFGGLGLYALRTLLRGRALGRSLAQREQPWR